MYPQHKKPRIKPTANSQPMLGQSLLSCRPWTPRWGLGPDLTWPIPYFLGCPLTYNIVNNNWIKFSCISRSLCKNIKSSSKSRWTNIEININCNDNSSSSNINFDSNINSRCKNNNSCSSSGNKIAEKSKLIKFFSLSKFSLNWSLIRFLHFLHV